MTISSTTRTAGPFTGDGFTVIFPFAFKVFLQSDIFVESAITATGVQTILALGPDYTVALNASQDSFPGGSITLTVALPVGSELVITSDILNLQPTEYLNQGGFYPEVLTQSLDRLTILIQQLATQVSRALQAPLLDSASSMTLPPAAERAGMLLMFDSNGNPSLITVAPGGIIPGAQAATGVVNSINTVFTFVASAASTPIPVVFAGGIFQSPATDYPPPVNVGGNNWQITFNAAPTLGPIAVLLFA